MKVLLRDDFKWTNVTFDKEHGSIRDASNRYIDECSIVSIKDDERKKYLRCSACGDFVLNTPEEIAKHIALKNSWELCSSCKHCRRKHIKTEHEVLNPNVVDSNFIIESRDVVELLCGNVYDDVNIFSQNARQSCRYRRCAAESLKAYDSAFIKYPDLFETMATVDALDTERWIYDSKSCGLFRYKLDARTNLYAYVHSTGIINHLEYTCRSNSERCYYSKQYDKLFWGPRFYHEEKPWFVGESVEKMILKEVRKIYGGNEE